MQFENTIITDNLDTIDYPNLKTGDQILLINNKYHKKINKIMNNYHMFAIINKHSNLIFIANDNVNYSTHNTEYDEYVEAYQDFDKFQLLIINNKVIKVQIEDISDTALYYNDFKRIKKLMKKYDDAIFNCKYDFHTRKINYYFSCPISEFIYLGVSCSNRFFNSGWQMKEYFYLYDEENEYYYEMNDFDVKQLFNLLETLNINLNEFEKFKQAYKIMHYDVEDYLKDNSILNDIINFYSDIPFLKKQNIKKFFKPIYETDNFKGYFKSRYSNKLYYSEILYAYDSDNKEELKINKRITAEIMNYLLKKDSAINIYTGKILNNDYNFHVDYEDSEHLIIDSKDYCVSRYYVKYNGIYVSATIEERNEMIELQETIKKLTS